MIHYLVTVPCDCHKMFYKMPHTVILPFSIIAYYITNTDILQYQKRCTSQNKKNRLPKFRQRFSISYFFFPFPYKYLPSHTVVNQHNSKVINKVSGFIADFVLIAVFTCNNNFGSLLTDFFQNLIFALIEQVICITASSGVLFCP